MQSAYQAPAELLITGAKVVLPDSVLENGTAALSGGKIVWVGKEDDAPPAKERLDAAGAYLSPGFIDLHTHGAGGSDFMDATPEAFDAALSMHLAHGTTAICPTTMTSTLEDLTRALESFREIKRQKKLCPELLGMHLEGPYFSPLQKGAQDEKYMCNPNPAQYNAIADLADGDILRWTVAVELPGACEMAEALVPRGIRFSIGHTDAQYCHVIKAVESGYTTVTHLYSSMSTITRENGFRKLGVIESGLLLDELAVEIIADGKHLPPELLRLVCKTKPLDKIILVTDSMRGAGMPEGEYLLGSLENGQRVIVEDGIAKTPDRTAFAGSVATADRLIRVMTRQAGQPIWAAVRMMSLNAAAAVGLDGRLGSIAPGKDADLLLFDEDVQIQSIWLKGQKVR